ncbi:MAG: hypothetical protein LBE04_03540 [Prevotellaceae bacterium]|jgi:hypothetical protein|nr:hypothetical protein [Prevotellaceae bacterium]
MEAFEYYNNVLCVNAGWLVKVGVVTKSNYDYYAKKSVFRVVRRGCRRTPALIEYCSLSDAYKRKIQEISGCNPVAVTPESEFVKHIKPDSAALKYFAEYRLPDGRNLPVEVQKTYYHNAMILNAINTRLSGIKAKRKSCGGTGSAWSSIAKTVNELNRLEYSHDLPSNARSLYDKYKEYKKNKYYSLIHKGYCNAHAKKVDELLERLILSIYAMGNKPYSKWVHEDYLRFIAGDIEIVDMETGELYERGDFVDEKTGTYIMISESTVYNYINKPSNRILVDSIRMSSHAYNNTHRPHYHRHAPRYSFSKISLDDRNLPHKMDSGKRVMVYYAYDVCSGVCIGVAYSLKKDANLFIDCIRDMFRFIDRNGWGVPLEVEVEHHIVSLFKDDLFKAGVVFPIVRWCAPSNSQEKHAEHFNRQLKYGYEKRYQEGVGRHDLRLEANRTGGEKVYDEQAGEYVTKEKTYRYETIIAENQEAISRYNNGLHRNQKLYKGKTRMQVLVENLNPDLAEVDRALLARYIGNCTVTSVVRNHYVTVQACKYSLPSPAELEKLDSYDVLAYYLPTAGEIPEVYLYQKDNYICCAKKIVTYSTAQAEFTELDELAMTEQAKYISQFDRMKKEGKQDLAKIKIIEKRIDCAAIEAVEHLSPSPEQGEEQESMPAYVYDAEFTKLEALTML